jgi:putative nucleotidyltransferase with HDIG domain
MLDGRGVIARLGRNLTGWRRGAVACLGLLGVEAVFAPLLVLPVLTVKEARWAAAAVLGLHALAAGLLAALFLRQLGGARRCLEQARQGETSPRALTAYRRLGQLGDELWAVLEDLKHARQELSDSHFAAVKAIALALEARDVYIQGHCLRVRHLARRILDRLQVEPAYRNAVELAALLHDVGKIGIPDSILLKPARLTPAEYARVMTHVEIGVELLECFSTLRETTLFVKHHHERFDGKGYPDGLKGEQIPLGSRVISIADAVDAMRSGRAYRAPMRHDEIVRELEAASGTQFDPRLVEVTLGILQTRMPEPVTA